MESKSGKEGRVEMWLKWKSAGMDELVSSWCDYDKMKKALLKKKEEREKVAKESGFLKLDWALKRGFLLN